MFSKQSISSFPTFPSGIRDITETCNYHIPFIYTPHHVFTINIKVYVYNLALCVYYMYKVSWYTVSYVDTGLTRIVL